MGGIIEPDWMRDFNRIELVSPHVKSNHTMLAQNVNCVVNRRNVSGLITYINDRLVVDR
jgi:hypothetical protein